MCVCGNTGINVGMSKSKKGSWCWRHLKDILGENFSSSSQLVGHCLPKVTSGGGGDHC